MSQAPEAGEDEVQGAQAKLTAAPAAPVPMRDRSKCRAERLEDEQRHLEESWEEIPKMRQRIHGRAWPRSLAPPGEGGRVEGETGWNNTGHSRWPLS